MHKKWSNETGYSLVSIMTFITILGVLSTMAIVSFNNSSTAVKLDAATRKLVSDISYAQDMAMTLGTNVKVEISVEDNQYRIKKGDGSYINSLMGGGNFIVDFDHANYAGVGINSTGLIQGVLSFNSVGIPSSGGAQLETKTVVAILNNQTTISVTPYTGKIVVE